MAWQSMLVGDEYDSKLGCVRRTLPHTVMADYKQSEPPPPYSGVDQHGGGHHGGGHRGGEGMGYPQPQVVTVQPQVVTQPIIIMGTSCPACRAGVLQNEFTCCGICLGIFFFPIGLVCCFLMQERRCSNCRMTYGGA
nr:brain protein I3-like [Procambarus clarkii]